MNTSAWIWTAIAVITAAISAFNRYVNNKRKQLPPSPKGLPMLGHLHLIGKNPHQDFQKLSKIYGPIMYLRFGLVENIIVSSPEATEKFLKTYDLNFASRPPLLAAKYISYGQKGLVWSEYGQYWRNMRKMCTSELLNNHKIDSFRSMRREEMRLLIESIKQEVKNHEPIDLTAKISSMSANMSCRMVFGKKYEDKDIGEKGFEAVIREAIHLTGIPNVGDYFPYLGKLDFQGLTRRMKDVSKLFNEFFDKIIDEHEQDENKGSSTKANKDFVDTMLATMNSEEPLFEFTHEHVKAMMMDMLAASFDTSTTVIEWTMSELLRHPEILKKVQEEVERQVGLDRMVEEEDLEGLKYLEMIIKESLRIHPPAPLLGAHAAIEDFVVDGFHIPKKARIFVNTWAIGHDPNVWSEAEKFIPERFYGNNIDYGGQHFELIPFGSGRRRCPGLQLGITLVKLLVAQLVHCFNWELPNGMLPNELDMSEAFSLIMSRAEHLMVIPKYRLHV